RIVSYHNMREMPADLEKIHQHMCGQDADVVKLAVRAQRPTDNWRVLELLHKSPKPTVAFCMGDLGLPSRILGARYGAPFTYAAFLKAFDAVPVQGYSVTIPHKEAAALLARHQDATAAQTHAANTLVRGPDGFTAYNTDYRGVLETLTATLPTFPAAPPAEPD